MLQWTLHCLYLKVLILGCKGTVCAVSVTSFANRVQESELIYYINVLYVPQNSILLLLMAFSETERQFLGKDYMSISALLEHSDKLSKDLLSWIKTQGWNAWVTSELYFFLFWEILVQLSIMALSFSIPTHSVYGFSLLTPPTIHVFGGLSFEALLYQVWIVVPCRSVLAE